MLVIGLAFAVEACGHGASHADTATMPTGIPPVAATAKRERTTFRFARAPIVVFYAAKGHDAQWTVVARLDKALPTGPDRRPRADLRIDGEPSETGVSRVGKQSGRACYVAGYGSEMDEHGAPQLVTPHDGRQVTVTLYFNTHKFVSTHRTALRRRSLADVNSDQGIQPYLTQLGCRA